MPISFLSYWKSKRKVLDSETVIRIDYIFLNLFSIGKKEIEIDGAGSAGL